MEENSFIIRFIEEEKNIWATISNRWYSYKFGSVLTPGSN